MSEHPGPQQGDSLGLQKYLDSTKKILSSVRSFDYKKFSQDVITFTSIIAAYFVISLSYQFDTYFRKILKINLKSKQTTPLLIFSFSIYLIFWNIVAYFLKKRALRPPPKKDEYEETPVEEPSVPVMPSLPQGEKYYHDIIINCLSQSTYFFLLLTSVAGYAYLNQPQIKYLDDLVDAQRINYIGIWFLMANLFYLIGSLLEQMTKMYEFKVLGRAMAFIVGIIVLGLANGLNTFIFI